MDANWIGAGISSLSVITFGVIGLIKIHNHNTRQTDRIDRIESNVGDHAKASYPHPLCEAHQTDLKYIIKSLDEMKESVRTLDQRVYDKIRNGNGATR